MESLIGSAGEALVGVLFLAVINSEIIDYLKAPLARKRPDLDLWWFVYVSFVTGILIAWFAGVNALHDVVENEIVARLLTGALVGGGSTLVYRVFKQSSG